MLQALLAVHLLLLPPQTCSVARAGEVYRFELFASDTTKPGQGTAIMQPQSSPFGVAVSPDGHHRYELALALRDLPEPSVFGPYTTYVAWVATPLLDHVVPMGAVRNGRNALGAVALNKFRVIITAEASADAKTRTGPIVLRGVSPTLRLQPHDYSNLGIGPPC